ncbi:MAG: TVP38/TMEM64 family protein [Clostridia bacterium]|nr:TVP38/TMEM64 family protein [Clostridia bacterium]
MADTTEFRQKSSIVARTLSSVLALINMVLVAVYCVNFNALLYYCALSLSCVVFVLSVAIKKTKTPLYKLLICINVVVFVVLAVYIPLMLNDLLWIFTDGNAIREYISGFGIWGILILFLLTLLEVVVLPIPAAVTIVIGTILFGPTVSFIVSTLGTIVGSVICFYLGRTFGQKLVSWIIGEDKTKKYSALLAEKGKVPFIIMMLFPFFPDDILCMVSGLTSMSFKFFITTVTITRPVMVAFYSYFGTGEIIPFSGWGIPVWIGLIAFAAFAFYLLNYLINKKKNKKSEDD